MKTHTLYTDYIMKKVQRNRNKTETSQILDTTRNLFKNNNIAQGCQIPLHM